jgi:hypothetical protein
MADAVKVFNKLCDDAYSEVRRKHTADYTTRIKGFFNNRVRRGLDASLPSTVRTVLGLPLKLIPSVPFVTAPIVAAANAALDALLDKVLKYELGGKIKDARQEAGEYLTSNVLPGYLDAIQKLDHAWAAVEPQPEVHDCGEISEHLTTVFYVKHRIERLRFYHEQIGAYYKAVDKKLGEAKTHFDNFEKDLRAKGADWYRDWRWHYANCQETCYWPDDFLEAQKAQDAKMVTAPPPPLGGLVKRPPPPPPLGGHVMRPPPPPKPPIK